MGLERIDFEIRYYDFILYYDPVVRINIREHPCIAFYINLIMAS